MTSSSSLRRLSSAIQTRTDLVYRELIVRNKVLLFSSLVDSISERVGNVTSLLFVPLMLFGTYEVVSRYFFNRPTIWAWETNALLMCCIIALGGAYTLLVRGHVKVEIVYGRFSMRTRAIMDIFSSFFMFLFLGMLLWSGIKYSGLSIQISEHSMSFFSPPIFPFKCILTIGIFLLLMQGLAEYVRSLHAVLTRGGDISGD